MKLLVLCLFKAFIFKQNIDLFLRVLKKKKKKKKKNGLNTQIVKYAWSGWIH